MYINLTRGCFEVIVEKPVVFKSNAVLTILPFAQTILKYFFFAIRNNISNYGKILLLEFLAIELSSKKSYWFAR